MSTDSMPDVIELTSENYRQFRAMNWSRLKHLDESPEYFQYMEHVPFEGSSFTAMGSAVHCLAYEREDYDDRFATYPGKVRRGKAWDEFKAEYEGKIILTGAESNSVLLASNALRNSPLAMEYLAGEVETAIKWTDPDTDLLCKSRVDNYNTRQVELKTTSRGVNPDKFDRAARENLYHAQCAFYADGLAANGIEVEGSSIVAVSMKAPYSVVVMDYDDDYIGIGRAIYKRLLKLYAKCLDADEWPGYATEVVTLYPPQWYYDAHVEDVSLDWEAA